MKNAEKNNLIAVDSETGVYWYGDRILRTKAVLKLLGIRRG